VAAETTLNRNMQTKEEVLAKIAIMNQFHLSNRNCDTTVNIILQLRSDAD